MQSRKTADFAKLSPLNPKHGSHIDLGSKNALPITNSRQEESAVFFC